METDKHGPELNEFKSKSYPFTPKSGKVKICQHFQIPFCKTLKNKLHNVKVLLKRIHLNGQTIRFRQQNQKLEPPYNLKMPSFTLLGVKCGRSCVFGVKSYQHAKKVVSDSPGLVDFAIELVNSVFNLPDGQDLF